MLECIDFGAGQPILVDILADGQSQAWKVSWWMYLYGSRSPKRSIAISNSAAIGALDRGPLKAWKTLKKKLGKHSVQTSRQYVGKDGRKRFHGTKALRSTQPLSIHGYDLLQL